MKWTSIALAFVTAGVAQAQLSIPPSAPDLTGYAKTSDVASAITAATPAPCSTPLPDTLTGTAGTQPVCMTRPDATRPTQVQSTRTITASDGSFTAPWPVSFPTAPTYVHAETLGGSQPLDCNILTVTPTGATGKCYALASTTLPGTLAALSGLVISATANPGANLTVMIVGRL